MNRRPDRYLPLHASHYYVLVEIVNLCVQADGILRFSVSRSKLEKTSLIGSRLRPESQFIGELLRVSTTLIAAGAIDHVEHLATADEAAQVLREKLAGKIVETRHRSRRGRMERQGDVFHAPQRAVGIERFRRRHVEARTAEAPALQRIYQRVL